MDRGFYSKDNINELYRHHCKFIVGAKTSVNFIRNIIREKAGEMKSWNNYRDEYGIYARGESMEWDYEQKRPYKGDTLQEKRRMYAHIYLDVERCANEVAGFMRKLRIAEQETPSRKRAGRNQSRFTQVFYSKCNQERETSNRGRQQSDSRNNGRVGVFRIIEQQGKRSGADIRALQEQRCCRKGFW